jgi:hypothetical protein
MTNGKTLCGPIPWGLIGMLGLILTVERAVIRHDQDLTGTVALNWRYARYAAGSRARPCEILCLGTSMIKFGIGSRIIKAGTGRRTFNLAMSASSLPANYFVLRRALAEGARPEAVLIDCLDDGIVPFQLRDNLRNYPELLTIGETLDIAWRSQNSDFLAAILLARLFPSLKSRFEIRNNVMAAFRGQSASARFEGRLVVRNWEANRGTSVIPRNLEFEARHRGETIQSAPRPPSREGLARAPRRGSYTQRFFDLAAAHDIRVFYLLPPVPPHTQESWIRSGIDEGKTRHVCELQADYPNLIVLDARRSGYTIDAFLDDVHLNAHGVSALSGDVASVMNRYLTEPATARVWVDLPPYQRRDMDPWLEDINQSGLAVSTERTRRR